MAAPMRPLTLRQWNRLCRIQDPTIGPFVTTKAEIAGYQALIDRGLARWLDPEDGNQCRTPQILPDGMRAIADFYAAGRWPELATVKAGGVNLAMRLPAICTDPRTPPPPTLWPRPED